MKRVFSEAFVLIELLSTKYSFSCCEYWITVYHKMIAVNANLWIWASFHVNLSDNQNTYTKISTPTQNWIWNIRHDFHTVSKKMPCKLCFILSLFMSLFIHFQVINNHGIDCQTGNRWGFIWGGFHQTALIQCKNHAEWSIYFSSKQISI